MSRRDRPFSIPGQWGWRTIEMMKSPAFVVLSRTARQILDRLEIEIANHGGTGNGALIVTYDDFEAYGIHRHQIFHGLCELEALGFIVFEGRGRAGNAEWRTP